MNTLSFRKIVLAGALSAVAFSAQAANPEVGGAAMYDTKNIVENAMNSIKSVWLQSWSMSPDCSFPSVINRVSTVDAVGDPVPSPFDPCQPPVNLRGSPARINEALHTWYGPIQSVQESNSADAFCS